MFDFNAHEPKRDCLAPPPVGPTRRRQHPTIKRLKNTEAGMATAVFRDIRERFAGNPIKQLDEFFRTFDIPSSTGRRRKVSMETTRNYKARLATVVHTLRKLNMPVRNLDELSRKQVRHLFEELEREGRSTAWMANVNTVVRRFGIWIGKPELCPSLGELVVHDWNSRRRVAADRDRSWKMTDEEFEDVLTRVGERCPMTALHLRLARLFGNRVQEFLMLRPSGAVQGNHLYLKEGTKGGRGRAVPIESDEQRKWIGEAIERAGANSKGRLMFQEGITLRQALHHFYAVLREEGIDQRRLGLTAHGLRHAYACDLYRRLTGEKPPIQGGGLVEPLQDAEARLEVSRRLGHGRISVTTAYLGSHRALAKYAKENLQRLDNLTRSDETIRQIATQGKLDSLYLLGPIAAGQTLRKGAAVSIGYQAKAGTGESQSEADMRAAGHAVKIAVYLGKLLGRPVNLRATNGEGPDAETELDRFELL